MLMLLIKLGALTFAKLLCYNNIRLFIVAGHQKMDFQSKVIYNVINTLFKCVFFLSKSGVFLKQQL